MAYNATVSDPIILHRDGRTHYTWTVTETDVGTTSVWSIPGLPTPCTVTLHKAHLEVAGAAATIQPSLGLANPPALGIDFINQWETAAVFDSVQTGVVVEGTTGGTATLYGKSNPNVDTGATGKVVTRITAVLGHVL